ncbi:response regulator [Longispora albida]|uniref:response regulator n=1 Tax=Longispora albida TaxID=203523 RepID=UPI0003728A4E|nr:response regulator transcription factor [Longispora albida]
MTTRIVIADDQENVRIGFRLVLDAQPDMTVVGEAASGDAALDLVRHLKPDVLLADIRMPGLDGIEVTRQLADDPARVIVVTTFEQDDYVRAALGHGASGFLLKRSGPALLVEAVRAAMQGDTLISPQLTVRLLRQLNPSPAVPEEAASVTSRELEIIRLVAQGATNTEIAAELFITAGTVKTHLANIQAKLGARNRVGIAAWAWSHGHA